jgi:hypothetical protein
MTGWSAESVGAPETIRKSDGDVPLVALFDANDRHLSSVA